MQVAWYWKMSLIGCFAFDKEEVGMNKIGDLFGKSGARYRRSHQQNRHVPSHGQGRYWVDVESKKKRGDPHAEQALRRATALDGSLVWCQPRVYEVSQCADPSECPRP